MHADDLAKTKSVMKRYFSELLGGPMQFSETRGHPALKGRHASMPIGQQERDAWMRCMKEALASVVPRREPSSAHRRKLLPTPRIGSATMRKNQNDKNN